MRVLQNDGLTRFLWQQPEATPAGNPGAAPPGAQGAPAEGAGSPAEGTQTPGDSSTTEGTPEAKTKAAGPPSHVPYPVFQEKLKERDEKFQQLSEQFESIKAELEGLRPQGDDALDTWLKGLPEGKGPADAEDPNAVGDEAYELRRNARALLPLLKQMRPHLAPPEYQAMRSLVAGLAAAVDRLSFLQEQIGSTFMELDEQGNLKADRRPEGLKHLERIEKLRQEAFEKSGRKRLLRYTDSFKQVQEQLRAESQAQAEKEEKLRQEGERRATKEITQRQSAAGSPAAAAAAPHRTRSAGPRTPQEIQREINAGKDFGIG